MQALRIMDKMNKVSVLFSTSLTAKNILDVLKDCGKIEGFNIIGILDDDPNKWNKEYYGYKVIGKFSDILKLYKEKRITHFAVGLAALKHTAIKEYVYNRCSEIGLEPISAIHKDSYISSSSSILKGCFILSFVTISPKTEIGANCSVYPGASILEGVKIGNNVAIHGNSFVGGESVIEDNVYIGPGVTIGSGVHIGKNSVIGAGSLVLKDIDDNSFAFGSPISQIEPNKYYTEVRVWD
jgi:sugar O-acyltransferase (sialic acid O-acetyltransferase NeuD family)